jgi:hypothetical protein
MLEIAKQPDNNYNVNAKSVMCFDWSAEWHSASRSNNLITFDRPIIEAADQDTNRLHRVTLPEGVFLARATHLTTFYKHLPGFRRGEWLDGAMVFASSFPGISHEICLDSEG